MLLSAVVRKSLTDLSRRKARAAFTVVTLALAVASIGILAVAPVMEQTMKAEVRTTKLSDLRVTFRPLPITAAELARLRRLPNVEAVQARSVFSTRVYVGARRDRALVFGVPDFARQQADIVTVEQGSPPNAGSVLTDRNNRSHNQFKGGAGTVARVVTSGGRTVRLPVTGVGRNLVAADDVVGGSVVLYADTATVARLRGTPGVTSLGFRLQDKSRAAAERTVAAVRDELRANTAFTAFDDLPVIQKAGSYPGKEEFEKITSVLDVVVLLAVLTALVLLSNTMSTLVGEQTREIAAMKAIGARRRDIRAVYLRTAMLFGVLGAVLGAGLGILLTNLLVGFLAPLGFGVDATFGVSWPVVAISAVAGLVGPPLAALPAIRRAARLPLVQALQASDSAAVGTQGRLDALLRRAGALPRPVQIGLRNMGRRKRRTVATVLQVSLAVATLLALLSLGAGVGKTARAWFDQNDFQIWVQSVASKPFDPEAQRTLASTPGVKGVQPWVRNQVRLAGKDVPAWGLPAGDLMMDTDVEEGRWYSAADVRAGAKVAVLGRTLARSSGKGVGDVVQLRTGGGPVQLRVIGISGNQAENTGVVFLPVTTLQAVLGVDRRTVNAVWVQTSSTAHARIDATTTRVEDALAAGGTQVETIVMYDARAKQIAANSSLTTMITILGLIIVAISMVGLVNAITMGILERTREIGVLRSIGARARDVRRIFATEGVAVAVAGWALGVPLGYVFARGMVWLVGESVGLKIAFAFPPAFVLLALLGTVVLALLVMVAPLRRAVRLRPGDALRHA